MKTKFKEGQVVSYQNGTTFGNEMPPVKEYLSAQQRDGKNLEAAEQLNRICYMMELDEKYASVILRRYVENTGDDENVYCIRNGQKVAYADVVKQVDGSSDNSSTNDLI